MEKPVFILGSHKSGSSLLRSLLDGAPELFVVPIETHFFQYAGYWVEYALRQSMPAKLQFNDLVYNFSQHIRKSNESSVFSSDSVMTGRWDVEAFVHSFKNYCRIPYDEQNIQKLFEGYINSIHEALFGRLPDTNRFAEKSVENAEFACYLRLLFPDAKFLHIIRNPFATIVSMRKHLIINQSHYPYLYNLVSSLNNSYYYLYKNSHVIDNYLVIRYEDLVENPTHYMRNIANFIDIEYSEDLLRPTSMGVQWKGNSTSNVEFLGISTTRVKDWQNEIIPIEGSIINIKFRHVIRDYGYREYTPQGSVYNRGPKEGVRAYIANRFFWLSLKHLHTN